MSKELENEISRINEIFDEYDEKKEGKLDKEAFCKVFRKLIKPLGEGDDDDEFSNLSAEAISRFDFNKNGFIEKNEFITLMRFLIDEKGLCVDDTY